MRQLELARELLTSQNEPSIAANSLISKAQ